MEGFRFYEGIPPSDYSLEFEESLFNICEHRTLQAKEGWRSFYILNGSEKKISAAIHFHVFKHTAQSPLKAPFGSLDFNLEVPAQVLHEFFDFLDRQFRAIEVTSITIKNYPMAYQPDHASQLQSLLLNSGYEVMASDIDSVLDITPGDVLNTFRHAHRKQFKKGQREGLVFREIGTDALDDIYHFIEQCRQAKGYSLSMSLDLLHQTTEAFPEHVKLFGVFKEDKLIAASIAIQVRKNILYDFYHDHDAAFDHVSPVVTLVAGMYHHCLDHAISLLDLGTSAPDGKLNFDLLRFKQNLGGRPTPKEVFHKKIAQ